MLGFWLLFQVEFPLELRDLHTLSRAELLTDLSERVKDLLS